MTKTGEREISIAIMRVADSKPNGIATFECIRDEVPNFVNLTDEDLTESQTRPGEALWYQIARNIKSHHTAEENFIELGYLAHIPKSGYQITNAGRDYLRSKGL